MHFFILSNLFSMRYVLFQELRRKSQEDNKRKYRCSGGSMYLIVCTLPRILYCDRSTCFQALVISESGRLDSRLLLTNRCVKLRSVLSSRLKKVLNSRACYRGSQMLRLDTKRRAGRTVKTAQLQFLDSLECSIKALLVIPMKNPQRQSFRSCSTGTSMPA